MSSTRKNILYKLPDDFKVSLNCDVNAIFKKLHEDLKPENQKSVGGLTNKLWLEILNLLEIDSLVKFMVVCKKVAELKNVPSIGLRLCTEKGSQENRVRMWNVLSHSSSSLFQPAPMPMLPILSFKNDSIKQFVKPETELYHNEPPETGFVMRR